MEIRIDGILKRLPHRFPFLMVDRVVEVSEDKSFLAAIKNVTANEPQFTGHFPTYPVMPGVLILEALAQAGALLAIERLGDEYDPSMIFFLGGIDKARFKHQVRPGDQMRLEITFLRSKAGVGKFHCEAKVEGNLACSADMICALRKPE